MKRIVIDTNAYSFLRHGRRDIAQLLFEYDDIIVPAVVVGELEAGFRAGTRYVVNKMELVRFLDLDRVHVANVDRSVAEKYGCVYAALKSKGKMIPLNDVWIASTALVNNADVVTFDRHFSNVDGLNLILKEVTS